MSNAEKPLDDTIEWARDALRAGGGGVLMRVQLRMILWNLRAIQSFVRAVSARKNTKNGGR